MPIRQDLDEYLANGKDGVRGYIRQIWDETELGTEHFDDLEWFDETEHIYNAISKAIEDCGGSPLRKEMYRRFLSQFRSDEELSRAFTGWLDTLDRFIELDEEKRELLANYMTRMLRGEFYIQHCTPVEAANVMNMHPASSWDHQFMKLENTCNRIGV